MSSGNCLHSIKVSRVEPVMSISWDKVRCYVEIWNSILGHPYLSMLELSIFSGIYFDSSIILDLDVMLFMELCAATNFCNLGAVRIQSKMQYIILLLSM